MIRYFKMILKNIIFSKYVQHIFYAKSISKNYFYVLVYS
eukprot:UN02450